MRVPPSGEQYEIVHGDERAVIVEVGGGIREYVHADRDVLHPYAVDSRCDGAHGTPLIPWPNRLADGRYTWQGQERQLELTEPEKHNAIHGLLRWRNWSVLDRGPVQVVVGNRLYPTDRWPFTLDIAIGYRLDDEGLTVETRARNLGDGPCPYACGQHPYLSPGAEARIDDCTFELKAATRIDTDPERQLPTGTEPVEGTDYDFRTPRRIGSLEMDHGFTDLERDAEGKSWVRLGCPDGHTVELWTDETYSVTQIYTADTLAPARRRRGLAAEPMSAPPNALATGELIVTLEPGEEHVARWGVRLR
jgi:aldose 1-epimerase